MRWSDERYVRVYTRDTGEWLALGWEAQALFLFALRKADRAGIVHTGKAGARGLAGMTGMPLEVVSRVLPLLLEDGCMRETAWGYIVPNFIAAQEVPISDAQRKRDQRERDRAKALAAGIPDSKTAQDIHAALSRQEVTPGGHAGESPVTSPVTSHQEITRGHAGSVTPNRAVPNRADPSQDLPPTAIAEAGKAIQDGLPWEKPPAADTPKPADLQALWNTKAHKGMSRWEAMGTKRKKAAGARLEEHPDLAWWGKVIERMNASPFLRGETGDWKAGPDFFLQPDTAGKVLEGKYDPGIGHGSAFRGPIPPSDFENPRPASPLPEHLRSTPEEAAEF